MGIKVQFWSPEKAKKRLESRLRDCKAHREKWDDQWESNESIVFNGREEKAKLTFESPGELEYNYQPDSDVNINYAFKHWRFVHAQMSANPPSVVARPTSSDPEDRRKADAADRLIRHAIRAYSLQELVDQCTAKTTLYGTGWIKTIWDVNKGDIIDFDEESGEVTMVGDLEFTTPSVKDVWADPRAMAWKDVEYIIERKWLTVEMALALYGEHAEVLTALGKKYGEHSTDLKGAVDLEEVRIPVYEYYEKGTPLNGMAGRFVCHLEDGTPLTEILPNPFAFSPPLTTEESQLKKKQGDKFKQGPKVAHLPFHIFTDIDEPDEVYGRSFIEYEGPIQELINKLDSVQLENVQAHGITRLVLPEGAEVAEDAITNSAWDVVKITGSQPPHFFNPPSPMPDAQNLRDKLQAGGDDMAGVNDAMMGKIERETSGFSMQYATNQGNMIRRRLFNKYVLLVESMYKSFLNLVRDNWDEPRIIQVLGKEKAFEALDVKGADIDGGFDIVVEYGASLSLDPTTRREEIMQLMPIFEKYGVDGKTIMSMLKLNELENIYDIASMSADRQRETFEEMLDSGVFIAPEEMENHADRLAFCYQYLESSEYKYLGEDQKKLIKAHVKKREELAAAGGGAPTPQEAGQQPPGPAGAAGGPPDAGALAPPQMAEAAPLG